MAKSVRLQVITPSKLFYEGDVELVIAKTLSGEEGFMANHSWACKLLDTGELWIQEAGSKDFIEAAISGGFVDIKEDIIIYTDNAEWPTDIDTERAQNARAKAEQWLSEHSGADENPDDIALAKANLQKQIVRVKAAAHDGHRRK